MTSSGLQGWPVAYGVGMTWAWIPALDEEKIKRSFHGKQSSFLQISCKLIQLIEDKQLRDAVQPVGIAVESEGGTPNAWDAWAAGWLTPNASTKEGQGESPKED